MPDNTSEFLCGIRGLSLPQSLNFPDEHDRIKPTRASRPRSVSPPRTKVYDWEEFCRIDVVDEDENVGAAKKPWRWSLKEFLFRSTSEGRGRAREKEIERQRLIQAALLAEKEKKKKKKNKKNSTSSSNRVGDNNSKKIGGRSSAAISKKWSPAETVTPYPPCISEKASKVQRRSSVSAHERYYSANRARAQAEAQELKKKTFLPYRHGLLGFLGPFQSSNNGTHNVSLSSAS